MLIPGDHLFWSYRLAKFEVTSERRGGGRLAFAEYERDLVSNLRRLAKRIIDPEELFKGLDPGPLWVRPKSAVPVPGDARYVRIPPGPGQRRLDEIKVRVVLEPSPEFAISEVLWLRSFGPVLDALLDPSCYGNRLHLRGTPRTIPAGGRRAFRYWVRDYQRFRNQALRAARLCLTHGRPARCVITTLDLASYYDHVDPEFLVGLDFVAELREVADAHGLDFDETLYVVTTQQLLGAFQRFRTKVRAVVGVTTKIGIPIGALTSRLIANVALARLDRHVREQPQVRYYGRYVDDMLVVEVPAEDEEVDADDTVPKALSRLLPLTRPPRGHDPARLDSARLGRPGSVFQVQPEKIRVFDLRGQAGLDHLETVSREFERMSSERRRFLHPTNVEVEETVMASDGAEPIRALRESDGLSLRRLAVSVACSKVATAAGMLSRPDAREYCRRHLGRAATLATDGPQWVDLVDVALRILGAALQSRDAETANAVAQALRDRASSLDDGRFRRLRVTWNGASLKSRARTKLREWLEEQVVETIAAATPFDGQGFAVEGVDVLSAGVEVRGKPVGPRALLTKARGLALADLRLADRERDLALGTDRGVLLAEVVDDLEAALAEDLSFRERVPGIRRFLDACASVDDPVFAGVAPVQLLLARRPPSYADILFRWMRAGRDVESLASVVNDVRGTRYARKVMLEVPGPDGRLLVEGGGENALVPFAPEPAGRTRLILANLCTEDSWWAASLSTPVTTNERVGRLERVLNAAIDASTRAGGRPSLLLLPELSLPRGWLREVCNHLLDAVPYLSLVAGLEYDVRGTQVYNEAVAFVPRPFHSAAGDFWTKRRPANGEGIDLKKMGFSLAPCRPTRKDEDRFRPMQTEHGVFLPLICSELLEVDTRARLLGRIDLLLVPSWNKDTTTFDYHVSATPLELHCFVAIANNGRVSDCRARAPIDKEPWEREVGRLIARQQNEVLVVDLDVGAMRAFQRTRYTDGKVTWKPLPPTWEWRKG